MTYVNWRELNLTTDEGLEKLNIAIAERLGWKSIGKMGNGWLLGIKPDSPEYLNGIANYATDLNAAIQLKHEGWTLYLSDWGDNMWYAKFDEDNGTREIGVGNKSPAVSICLAWLAVEPK